MKPPKPKSSFPPQPKNDSKGRTGRFVPCPAGRWRHKSEPLAIEVRWSFKKASGGKGDRLSYYFHCPECEFPTQVFLNDWSYEAGFTLIEAERNGYKPKVNDQRREELLEELGVKQVQAPPLQTKPNHYAPITRGKKSRR